MIRDAKWLIAADVARSLATLPNTSDVDAGTVRLARMYADQIDQAAWVAEALEQCLRDLTDVGADTDVFMRVHQLAARVTEQATLATLGPKLLACLDALGLTPKARKTIGKTGALPGAGALGKLRAVRSGEPA